MDTSSTVSPHQGGYVLIYRQLLQNPIFRTDAEAMAFALLVMKASWKDVKVRYKDKIISLQRGQVAISSRDLAERLERNKDWANRFFKRLSDCDMVRVTSATGVNVVTICNYDSYQGACDTGATAPRHDRDTSDPQNNKGNKGNKDNKINKLNTTTARGTRLPKDWIPSVEYVEFAKTELNWTDGDVAAEAMVFRDHWIADSSARGVKSDWLATWRNWVRRSYRKPSSAGEAEYPTPEGYKDRKTYLQWFTAQWAGYNWSALEAGSDEDKAYAAKTRKQVSVLRKELKEIANGPA